VCGICGKLNFDRAATIAPALCKEMADTIRHRGPDDEGYYVSGPVGLGFRRLSIIDLNTGHQPLSNEDGTVWIVFNGEIYNYQDLRQQLLAKGHVFRTKTDTEVIVHLYEEYGESCVEKLRGMFAFAVWDDREKVLLLARDRVGIKPLYYRLTDKSIIFGSEIKTILADPEVRAEVVPGMIDRFFTFYYVPGEETLFKDIRKLAPGSHMVVRGGNAKITQYWDLCFSTTPRSMEEAERELLSLLEESVGLHMISDVPLGFLLSGGVDSTAMLGLAMGRTQHAISSYTIGFSDPGVTDERPYARLAAARYGSEHHEMTIGARDFADFLPHYIWHMEEPVCEPPAVALFYISKLAKQFVKVLISGEGGDEAFAGYPNYRSMLWLERLKNLFQPFKMAFPAVRSLFSGFPVSSGLRRYSQLLGMPLDSYYYSRTSNPFTFFNSHKAELYSNDFLHLVGKNRSVNPALGYLQNGFAQDTLSKMLYVDTKTWLPDDLLIKADRMTMANSVELRVPLLDHKILEFAASLQGNYKVRGLATKYIAKKALSRRVPREILDRKKTGFPVPYDSWMRGELKGWLRDILLDSETSARGYFRKSAIEKLLVESADSGRNSKELFSLAILELWHRQFLGKENQTSHPPSLDRSEDLVARS
jgi:asparagine synthase (glutamine-hydrolysing)